MFFRDVPRVLEHSPNLQPSSRSRCVKPASGEAGGRYERASQGCVQEQERQSPLHTTSTSRDFSFHVLLASNVVNTIHPTCDPPCQPKMALAQHRNHLYSIIIAIQPDTVSNPLTPDWRVGEINVDWVDFTREKSLDKDMSVPVNPRASWSKKKNGAKLIPGAKSTPSRNAASKHPTPDSLSLQPLLAHFPGPNPLDSSVASGVTPVGRGVVHLFRHAPPPSLVSSLEAQSAGESSRASKEGGEWAGDRAEGEDGSLIAILAVPAWMRPADFLEFIGGWGTCLEGVRMIRSVNISTFSEVLIWV